METLKRKRKGTFLVWFLVLFLPFSGNLQAGWPGLTTHPVFFSTTAGVFRISAEHFDRYYSSPWGFLPGFQAGVGISPSAFVVLKGAQFRKSGTKNATWKQKQLELGFRKYSVGFSPAARTYMGFGLAFFHVRETGESFLRELGQNGHEAWPKGFFIDLGYEQTLARHLFFTLNFDLSSAGMYSGSTLQRQSLGGFSASSGLKLQFF
jgi:hypothetical protein